MMMDRTFTNRWGLFELWNVDKQTIKSRHDTLKTACEAAKKHWKSILSKEGVDCIKEEDIGDNYFNAFCCVGYGAASVCVYVEEIPLYLLQVAELKQLCTVHSIPHGKKNDMISKLQPILQRLIKESELETKKELSSELKTKKKLSSELETKKGLSSELETKKGLSSELETKKGLSSELETKKELSSELETHTAGRTTTTATAAAMEATAATTTVGSKRKHSTNEDTDEQRPAKKQQTKSTEKTTKTAENVNEKKRWAELDKKIRKVLKDAFDVNANEGFQMFGTSEGNKAWFYLQKNSKKLEKDLKKNVIKSDIFSSAFSILVAFTQYDFWINDNEVWTEESFMSNTLKSFGNVWQKLLTCDNSELKISDGIRKSTMKFLKSFQKVVQEGNNTYDDEDLDFVYKGDAS